MTKRFLISSRPLRDLILVSFFFTSSIIATVPPTLKSKPAKKLVAAVDGTMSLVESDSGNVIWSFSSGSPIYSSYQIPINSFHNVSEYVECGDNWEFILHDKRSGTKKILSETIEDYFSAPVGHISYDNQVVLGTQSTIVFTVDGETGRVVGRNWIYEEEGINVRPELLIHIFRVDRTFQSIGLMSGVTLWSLKVAEFKARCTHNPNPASITHSMDFQMPYSCNDVKANQIYRKR